MKNISKILIFGLFASLLMGFAAPVLAYYPTMSVYSSGSDTSITISGGQPDAAVVINFTPSGSSLPTTITGTTDFNGNFTTDVGSVSSQITATVGGQQVTGNGNNGGCTYNCGTPYGLSLSQSSLSLASGQSSYVTISGGGSYYISSNTNSSIASVSLSGSQVTVYGETAGSSSISICSSSAGGVCATLYVTVTGSSCIYGNYSCGSGSLSLSQTSLNLSQGQTSSVTIYNNGYSYNNYYISNNSNISVASASISGSSVLVSALAAGNTTISVCQNSNSQCASLYVTVTLGSCGYYGCGSGSLSLSQTSLNLGQGQSSDVTINGSGSYYISSNSNSSEVNASISGNILLLTGIYTGSSTITVCQSSGSSVCASVYVTVNGTGTGSLSLSQTSLSLSTGQSATVSAYNYTGGSLYVSSNSNSGVASASVSGSVITLYALGSGSSTIIVCGGSSSQCGSIYVTVNGSGSGGSLYLSQTNLSLNQGQSSNIIISGSGSYYISTNSNLSVVSATISGSSLFLSALESGSSTVTVCQSSSYSGCASVYVTVNGGSGNGSSAVYFSPSSVSLTTGQNTSVVISSSYNNGYNGYYISSNSNSYVVTATVSGSSLSLYGQTAGNSSISVCQSSGGGCGTLYVTVGSGYYSGSISLSQTNLTLTSGQTDSVNIYGSGNYYISNNSNPAVVSVTISGSVLNLYPSTSAGTSTVTVCQSSGNGCASLYVTTSGYNGSGNGSGGLYFTTTTPLPLMTAGQYYDYQLQVSGGQAPYYFNITSGSLPAGLSLSSAGLISGSWVSGGYQTFTVTANDSYGHSATQNFSLGTSGSNSNPGSGLQYPGGGVLGASTYPNGELISQGGTVYIVYKNLETAFSSAAAFLGLGFKFSNVVPVISSGLQSSGYAVTSQYSQHPWGTWIKSGSTVYFVDETGLIPIPSWDIFLQNNGQQNLIVPANSYDFRLPILTPMTAGDSRLQ